MYIYIYIHKYIIRWSSAASLANTCFFFQKRYERGFKLVIRKIMRYVRRRLLKGKVVWLELIELMLADQRRAAIIKKATNFVNVKANVTESARNRRCSQKDFDQRDRDCFLSNDVQNDVFVNFQNCIHGEGGGEEKERMVWSKISFVLYYTYYNVFTWININIWRSTKWNRVFDILFNSLQC